jgi:prepilin-type N-terminal cleavage/methylation domain-containing protein
MIRQRDPRNAFSLTELLAAVVIITVVAVATVSTVTPLRARAHRDANEKKLAELNELATTYFLKHDQYPPNGVVSIIESGLTTGGWLDDENDLAQVLREFRYDAEKGIFTPR